MKLFESELFKYLEVLTYTFSNFRYQQLLQTADVLSEGQYLVTFVEINALNTGNITLQNKPFFFSAKENHI